MNELKPFLKFFLIFILVTGWVFSGFPRIWQEPPFPPKIQEARAATETFITAGTFTNGWTAPADVYSVTAETWGGGGGSGGGTNTGLPGGSGGGGGAYASKVIAVTPLSSYTYVVGAAGLKDGGTAGGDSSFTGNASVQSLACGGTSGAADGGTAGAGGTIACSDGTTEFAGGAGAAGAGTSGGGGGESAGTTATGGSAIGTAGGTGTDGTDGSAGQLINVNGVAGNNPGAGAGGSGRRQGGNEQGASGGVGQVRLTYVAITAALTGTVTESITEANIVTGGKTIILTVTGDTWVAGPTFESQRQNIINGIDSAQSETNGWDAEVKAKEVVGAVVRTSDTVVTITLTAQSGYNITATETITATIPATALVGGNAITATPTFTIDTVADVYLYFSTDSDASGNVSFPGITPGTLVATTSILTARTDNSTGLYITVERNDTDTTMDLSSDASINISDKTNWDATANANAGNATASSTENQTLQFRVWSAGTDAANYSSTWWGTNDTTASALFAGFPLPSASAGAKTIVNRSSSAIATTTVIVLYNLNVPLTQHNGTYNGTITYTATTW